MAKIHCGVKPDIFKRVAQKWRKYWVRQNFNTMDLLFGQKRASNCWKSGVRPKLTQMSGGVKHGHLKEGGPKKAKICLWGKTGHLQNYQNLGVLLTSDFSWRTHVSSRGDRLFHFSSAWCHGERLPVNFAVSVF